MTRASFLMLFVRMFKRFRGLPYTLTGSKGNRQTLKTRYNRDFNNQTLTGEICKTDSETKTALIYQSMLFHAGIFKPRQQSKITRSHYIEMVHCGMYRQETTTKAAICGNHSSNWRMLADSIKRRNKVNHHAKQYKDHHQNNQDPTQYPYRLKGY